MGAMASQITILTIVYSTVQADERKHQSSASLAFVREIHRKMFPFDDVIVHIDGLMQNRSNSSALAMKLRLFSIKPSIYTHHQRHSGSLHIRPVSRLGH